MSKTLKYTLNLDYSHNLIKISLFYSKSKEIVFLKFIYSFIFYEWEHIMAKEEKKYWAILLFHLLT